MAVFITMATETKGIGPTYAATALGALFTMERVGLFIFPYIGGYLAKNVSTELPFVFWGALAAMSFVVLYFLKETKTKSQPAVYTSTKFR
jgi:hypothetical protein